jgi:predicted DNA-binding protein
MMGEYTQRVQTVLTDKQYAELTRLSADLAKPVSVLIREAVEIVYLDSIEKKRRLEALEELLSLEAPVADWEQMEAEIINGAIG